MLEVRNICKTFNPGSTDEIKALRNVSFSMPEGDYMVVVGTNGSGKTTLMNALSGTFLPDEGSIVLDGKEITSWKEHQRAEFIGRIFQNPFSGTAPDMSIAENLALASYRGRIRGFKKAVGKESREEFRRRVQSLNMGLEERLDNPIGTLSGGQRQALTLLMATWIKPRLLLLDEHTAALDPKTAGLVIELTEKIIRRDRLTTLMVTHSMQQAINLGNRLIMMHGGRIIHDFGEQDKKRMTAGDIIYLFDEVRRKEQIDEPLAEMIRRQYI